MTPREKVLRECVEHIAKLGDKEIDDEPTCLQCCESLSSCDDDNPWCPGRQTRAALAAADAIPDAPVSRAQVIADGRQVGTLVTAQRVDLRESPPVPSRAELIELMVQSFGDPECTDSVHEVMDTVLDALIKAGAVKP